MNTTYGADLDKIKVELAQRRSGYGQNGGICGSGILTRPKNCSQFLACLMKRPLHEEQETSFKRRIW